MEKNNLANNLISRFTQLTTMANGILSSTNQANFIIKQDMKDWSKNRQRLYKFSNPYFFINDKYWLVYYILTIVLIATFLFSYSSIQRVVTETSLNLNLIEKSLIFILIIQTIINWIEFLRDKRVQILPKLVILGFIFATTLLMAIYQFSTPQPSKKVVMMQDLSYVWFLILLLSTPILIFSLNTILSLFWFAISIIRTTKTIQSPLPFDAIHQLINSEFVNENNPSEKWKLLNLPIKEIKALKKWGEVNREASEKRTIPALVVTAILGILIEPEGVIKLANLAINSMSTNRLGFQPIIVPMIFAFIIAFVQIFLESLVTVFKNIATQSLVIESCIVAEFAIEQNEEDNKKENNKFEGTIEIIWEFVKKLLN